MWGVAPFDAYAATQGAYLAAGESIGGTPKAVPLPTQKTQCCSASQECPEFCSTCTNSTDSEQQGTSADEETKRRKKRKRKKEKKKKKKKKLKKKKKQKKRHRSDKEKRQRKRRKTSTMSLSRRTELRKRAYKMWHQSRWSSSCFPCYNHELARTLRRDILDASPRSSVAPKCGVINWFSGGALGTDELALHQMGGVTLLHLDIRPSYLEWTGEKAVRWSQKRTERDAILQQIRDHDYATGPFRLAASVRAGFLAPNVNYDNDVGTFKITKPEHPKSDMNRILRALREAVPHLKLIMLASPPCRMTSKANIVTDKKEKDEFVRHIEHTLRGLRYALEFGTIDELLVEESAKGHRDKHGKFVPSKDALKLLDALNCVDEKGEEVFEVEKIDAAYDCGGPSTRQRCLFARKHVMQCLPSKQRDGSRLGYGHVLGVSQTNSILRTVHGTWMPESFSGIFPRDACSTLTTHVMRAYLDHDDVKRPTLVDLDAVERALLMGCRPNDPRLVRLLDLPLKTGRALTGITFSVQWYLFVVSAAMAAAGCLAGQAAADEAYWRVENERRRLHRAPSGSKRTRWHQFLADLKDGMSEEEYSRRLPRLCDNVLPETPPEKKYTV